MFHMCHFLCYFILPIIYSSELISQMEKKNSVCFPRIDMYLIYLSNNNSRQHILKVTDSKPPL